jgi:hypothetical protein
VAEGIPLLMDDSSGTATADAWVPSNAVAFASFFSPGRTGIVQTFWKQQEPQARGIAGFLGSGLVSTSVNFFHNTLVTTPTYVSVVAATAQSVDYSYYRWGTTVTGAVHLRDLALPATRVGYDTWTRPGWEPASSVSVEFASAIASIDHVISSMRIGQAIVRSTRLLKLAERAARNQSRDPKDIEAWAQKLAEDVKDADD